MDDDVASRKLRAESEHILADVTLAQAEQVHASAVAAEALVDSEILRIVQKGRLYSLPNGRVVRKVGLFRHRLETIALDPLPPAGTVTVVPFDAQRAGLVVGLVFALAAAIFTSFGTPTPKPAPDVVPAVDTTTVPVTAVLVLPDNPSPAEAALRDDPTITSALGKAGVPYLRRYASQKDVSTRPWVAEIRRAGGPPGLFWVRQDGRVADPAFTKPVTPDSVVRDLAKFKVK